jgi:hypothetical protein
MTVAELTSALVAMELVGSQTIVQKGLLWVV